MPSKLKTIQLSMVNPHFLPFSERNADKIKGEKGYLESVNWIGRNPEAPTIKETLLSGRDFLG